MDHFDKDTTRFNRQFDRIERSTPGLIARVLRVLRHPLAMIIRIPLGILFVVGGMLSFLPILGIWMLPLGLLFLAVDIPFLRGPLATTIIRMRRWWAARRYRRNQRRG